MIQTPAEGDLVADRYRLVSFIGEGGLARAWRGRDEETGRDVVIKFPNYDSSNTREVVEAGLRSELEILQTIRDAGGHPNLMGLVDSSEVDGTPVIVVEFVEGEDMIDAVKRRNGITDEGDIRTVGIALCEAMSFLHQNEIIYRDLKPDNVILRPDLTPVLIDFNTAKGYDPEARGGTVIPNPVYKPPELNNDPELVGYRQGPWSDVYSIGKVLMFLISGRGVRKDAVDPRDFPGTRSTPEYLAEIIARATQRHKDDRYRNATVLAYVLEHRDPEPPAFAHVRHVQTGKRYEIFPGDTIGRAGATGPQPSIAIPDPNNYVSAVQAQFEFDDDGGWVITDRSLNGTWVSRDDGWQHVLSAAGRSRLEEMGREQSQDGAVPPERMALEDGDRIALVHPDYDVWLDFEER